MFYIYTSCDFQQQKSHDEWHSRKHPFSKVFPPLNKFISKNKSLLTEVLTLGVEKVSVPLVFCCCFYFVLCVFLFMFLFFERERKGEV